MPMTNAKLKTTLKGGLQTASHQYADLRQIGLGGNGLVFSARQDGNALVAVKLLAAEAAQKKDKHARFMNESDLLRRLSSLEAVVPVPRWVDSGELFHAAQCLPFFVMEHCKGALDVRASVADADIRRRYVFGLTEALAFLHAQDVVHRDLKPENCLVASDGRVLVADFGIATAADRLVAMRTRTGERMANWGYRAPEVLNGEPGTRASDLFAYGLMIHELTTGRIPGGRGAWLSDDSREPFMVGFFLDLLMDSLLHERPDRRPQSALAVVPLLEAAMSASFQCRSEIVRREWSALEASRFRAIDDLTFDTDVRMDDLFSALLIRNAATEPELYHSSWKEPRPCMSAGQLFYALVDHVSLGGGNVFKAFIEETLYLGLAIPLYPVEPDDPDFDRAQRRKVNFRPEEPTGNRMRQPPSGLAVSPFGVRYAEHLCARGLVPELAVPPQWPGHTVA